MASIASFPLALIENRHHNISNSGTPAIAASPDSDEFSVILYGIYVLFKTVDGTMEQAVFRFARDRPGLLFRDIELSRAVADLLNGSSTPRSSKGVPPCLF